MEKGPEPMSQRTRANYLEAAHSGLLAAIFNPISVYIAIATLGSSLVY